MGAAGIPATEPGVDGTRFGVLGGGDWTLGAAAAAAAAGVGAAAGAANGAGSIGGTCSSSRCDRTRSQGLPAVGQNLH